MRIKWAVLVLWLLSASICTVLSDRILMLAYPKKSHVTEFRMIGEELVQRGHHVYLVLPPSYPGFKDLEAKTPIRLLGYRVKTPDRFTNREPSELWMEQLIRMSFLDNIVKGDNNQFSTLPFCTNPLSDAQFMATLKEVNFDLAIVDNCIKVRCFYIIAYKLNIPYVSEATQFEPWLMRNPALPSFVPWPIGTCDYGYTHDMTFWQRVYNTYILFKFMMFPGVESLSDDLVRKYAPEKPFVTIETLAAQSKLWLMNTDVILDFPRPSMPNMVEVGGLSTKPAQPLPPDLEEFVSRAEHGVIVASFGSLGSNLPDYVQEGMKEAFFRVKQRVVWAVPRRTRLGQVLPENVRTMSWIPQNDLLGHNNTKLFITHCGANGQFEAVYHAVPMIAMPLFAEQPYNALRGEYRQISITMDVLDFTADQLVEAINRVSLGPYKDNIQKLSKMFHSRPLKPAMRAAFWIEHILEFGGDHLRSHAALDMPWYQFMMLDILVFICGTLFSTLWVLYCCFIQLYNACHFPPTTV